MESILTCHQNRYKMKPSMERVPHFRYQPHFLIKNAQKWNGFHKIKHVCAKIIKEETHYEKESCKSGSRFRDGSFRSEERRVGKEC